MYFLQSNPIVKKNFHLAPQDNWQAAPNASFQTDV